MHKRVRRARVLIGGVSVALVVVVAVLATTTIRGRDNSRVRISGASDKEVSVAAMQHVDAIVVPATPEVKELLNTSPATRFAFLPRDSLTTRTDNLLAPGPLCYLKSAAGYAVAVDTAPTDLAGRLSTLLAGRATVHDVSDSFGADVEVFMRVGAPLRAVQQLRTVLQHDSDIESMQYVSPSDAMEIFRREFANQPDLIRSTHPGDLPASFRLILGLGISKEVVTNRYESRAGVDTVIATDFAESVTRSLATEMPPTQFANSAPNEVDIFAAVGASRAVIQGIRAELERDPDIDSFEYVDQQQAYAIFSQDFADQPALVASTKPSDLPVSFRVIPRRGTVMSAFSSGYQRLAGVETVIEPGSTSPDRPPACP